MSTNALNEEKLKEMSMLEIALKFLNEENAPLEYNDLLKRVVEVKGFSEQEASERIAQLYTEMTLDGRFLNLGDTQWGLRKWYPFDQSEEELSQAKRAYNKKKDKKASAEQEGDLLLGDVDEFEDIEDELDELANDEDTDVEPTRESGLEDSLEKVDKDDDLI
ncbi:DNA-directed RNA polymerase subunit delta [Texcoconibacillus texcoconensis]|uniref:Probable DNA-directed RNA polymerase subunit delta n=1 Tax=Texcoconibacillus texcoconensis TaxID=1095777 RepID=A0A840QRK7_9BACI|nr:DNA-directed RNA polymerase subunit delta [Texcoconibacillus texcoconensis]MBB5174106.1 DNA-directed RNA polymerase subunit delta [Texcoconibacillus texcoconensis]